MRQSAKIKAKPVLPQFCEFRAMCLAEQNLVLYGAIEKLVEMDKQLRIRPVPGHENVVEIIGDDGWPE